MPATVRVLAAALPLALLLPAVRPLLSGLHHQEPVACCNDGVCLCAKPRPAAPEMPCHGQTPGPTAPAMRCHHPGPDVRPPFLGALLPEPAVSVAAFADHGQPAGTRRERPCPGFRRIESPPPRHLVLAS